MVWTISIFFQTSGGDYEMLAGNLAAIGVGGIIATVSSYFVSWLPAVQRVVFVGTDCGAVAGGLRL